MQHILSRFRTMTRIHFWITNASTEQHVSVSLQWPSYFWFFFRGSKRFTIFCDSILQQQCMEDNCLAPFFSLRSLFTSVFEDLTTRCLLNSLSFHFFPAIPFRDFHAITSHDEIINGGQQPAEMIRPISLCKYIWVLILCCKSLYGLCRCSLFETVFLSFLIWQCRIFVF